MVCKKDYENVNFWPLGTLLLSLHWVTCTNLTSVYPLLLGIIPAKYDFILTILFEREDETATFSLGLLPQTVYTQNHGPELS